MSNDIEHRAHFGLILPPRIVALSWVTEIYNTPFEGPECNGVLEFKCGESEEKNYQMFNEMKMPIISTHFPLTICQT